MSALNVVQAETENGMMTPKQFAAGTLMGHEGGLSIDRDDRGNWYKGKLVGSKYGVTGATLAAYRKTANISAEDMAELTRDEAVEICLSLYFRKPRFDDLEWNPVTVSIVDMGYNAGPATATIIMQKMIGVGADGRIGHRTLAAFEEYVEDHGVEQAAHDYCDGRIAYYERIIAKRPRNSKYRKGWQNRAKSFLPATKFWRDFYR